MRPPSRAPLARDPFLFVRRGGPYLRVADPDWEDPLDGSHARARGGRWNPPGSFPVIYLCASLDVARAFVRARFRGEPYGPEDLDPDEGPSLVATVVRDDDFVDVVTDAGCRAAGLPPSYPLDRGGHAVAWERCRPVGRAAWDAGTPGIACRSAALPHGEELAWFQRRRQLRPERVSPFADWYWPAR